ncbi:MAG TPA: hypothetical protein VJ938_05355 [Acidimicrobiia bacterium]|nr:hypothetical protein [Acidimicrobiia bacterium]
MRRLHKKLFRITDRLHELAEEEAGLLQELDMHRSIDGDAQRDAATGNYIDREEAGLTAADVARFERSLRSVRDKRAKLDSTRLRLLERLER